MVSLELELQKHESIRSPYSDSLPITPHFGYLQRMKNSNYDSRLLEVRSQYEALYQSLCSNRTATTCLKERCDYCWKRSRKRSGKQVWSFCLHQCSLPLSVERYLGKQTDFISCLPLPLDLTQPWCQAILPSMHQSLTLKFKHTSSSVISEGNSWSPSSVHVMLELLLQSK